MSRFERGISYIQSECPYKRRAFIFILGRSSSFLLPDYVVVRTVRSAVFLFSPSEIVMMDDEILVHQSPFRFSWIGTENDET